MGLIPCAPISGLFTSQTDTSYDIDQWVIEQHNRIDTLPGSSIQTSWSKKGSYDIKLYPVSMGKMWCPNAPNRQLKRW
ncbi:MAG: hypothetical protein H6608_04835 [Flavobacteriales bacterium]|nr:hypothetical protein [Flavobacteriales bacterium]